MSGKSDRIIDFAFRLVMAAVVLAVALAVAGLLWAQTRGYLAPARVPHVTRPVR